MKDNKPEVKVSRYCKDNVPQSIWANISGAFSAIKFGSYNIEYIPKSVADERMQELRDRIKELEHQNSGLRQKIRGKFEWNEIE